MRGVRGGGGLGQMPTYLGGPLTLILILILGIVFIAIFVPLSLVRVDNCDSGGGLIHWSWGGARSFCLCRNVLRLTAAYLIPWADALATIGPRHGARRLAGRRRLPCSLWRRTRALSRLTFCNDGD